MSNENVWLLPGRETYHRIVCKQIPCPGETPPTEDVLEIPHGFRGPRSFDDGLEMSERSARRRGGRRCKICWPTNQSRR